MLDLLRFLYNIPVFVLTAVHESGHAFAALILNRRVHSIRALGVCLHIRGRTRKITLQRVAYRKKDYGELCAEFPRGRQNPVAEIFFSSSGFLAEGALLWWLWTFTPPHVTGTNAAYILFVLFWFSATSIYCALTADRGSDLYYVLRDLKKLARKIAR